MSQAEGPPAPPTASRAGLGLTLGSSTPGRLPHMLQGLGQSRGAGHQDEDTSPALSRCSVAGREADVREALRPLQPTLLAPPGQDGQRSPELGPGRSQPSVRRASWTHPSQGWLGGSPAPPTAEACKPLEAENRGFHQNPHWLREPAPARSAVGSQPTAPGPRLPPCPPHSHPCNS